MSINQLITEKVIPYIYQSFDSSKLKRIEGVFLSKKEQLQPQFVDYLAFDYFIEKNKNFVTAFLLENEKDLSKGEIDLLKKGSKSYLGIYEVTKETDGEIHLKNLFTEDRHIILKELIGEDLGVSEILLVRIDEQETKGILSSNVIVLPYQFKTMLVGQIIESYDKAKSRDGFLTFAAYFKSYGLDVLEIINKLLSYENQEGDCTLYQSIYVVTEKKGFKESLENIENLYLDKEENSYQLKHNQYIVAILVYSNNRLEVECNNLDDLQYAKDILEEELGQYLHHLKDEELTIDDLL